MCFCFLFFFKQKTAYEMRISDWSSDVCSSDLDTLLLEADADFASRHAATSDFLVVNELDGAPHVDRMRARTTLGIIALMVLANTVLGVDILVSALLAALLVLLARCVHVSDLRRSVDLPLRSEAHTSELQSLIHLSSD